MSSVTKSSGDQDSGFIISSALMEKVAPTTKVKLLSGTQEPCAVVTIYV